MRWRSHNCSVSLLLKSTTKLTNLPDLALYRAFSRNSFGQSLSQVKPPSNGKNRDVKVVLRQLFKNWDLFT